MSDTPPPPDTRPRRRPGDAWVDCACGNRHWGSFGAAGLLIWRRTASSPDSAGAPDSTGSPGIVDAPDRVEVLLQHRALWTHHGGTWGVPGGALIAGESALDGAIREASEEAGLAPEAVRVRAARALVHPDWSYTTVVAEAVAPFTPAVSDAETLDVRWVDLAALDDYELLPAFATALPELRTMLHGLVLVVDSANVVGSRPDGWWKDRQGATEQLRDHLAGLARGGLAAADLGLPGGRWFPELVLVTEGRARGVEPSDGVQVVEARASGDDEIVATVARLRRGPGSREADPEILVATADRGLSERVRGLGARTVSPRLVRAPGRDAS